MIYNSKRPKNFILLFITIFMFAALLSSCSQKNTEYSKSGIYFDTVISITLYDAKDASLIDDCFAMADHYEQIFSRTIDTSDVSRINHARGEYVEVDEDTLELIQYGLKYSELSNGKFDITIGALSDLWDFKNNTGTVPDAAQIQSIVSSVDYHAVSIQNEKVALTNPNAMLDLGGIAKGYIADKMKAYLVDHGVTSGMINLGGNVLVIGAKTNGDPYSIGVQKPFDETNTPLATLKISDQTVVSSGVYERYFEKDGKIYHHILDTETGYPIENHLYGVTIICKNSVDGDGLSTTCFALGTEEGLKLIESLPDTEAIFITDEMEIITSSGIGTTVPFNEM